MRARARARAAAQCRSFRLRRLDDLRRLGAGFHPVAVLRSHRPGGLCRVRAQGTRARTAIAASGVSFLTGRGTADQTSVPAQAATGLRARVRASRNDASRRRNRPGPPRTADGPARGRSPARRPGCGPRAAAVTRVDHGVGAALQDQRAGPDARCRRCPAYRLPRPPGPTGLRRPLAGNAGARPGGDHSGWSRTVRADSAFSVCRRSAASAVRPVVAASIRTEAAGMG